MGSVTPLFQALVQRIILFRCQQSHHSTEDCHSMYLCKRLGEEDSLSQKKWQDIIALQYNVKVNKAEKTYNKMFSSTVECCSHQLSCLDLKLTSSTNIRVEYLSISCGKKKERGEGGGERDGGRKCDEKDLGS